jgi:hypothetical protein
VCHDAEPCLQAKNLKQHEILVNTWLAYLWGRRSFKLKFFYIQGQLITSQTGKYNFNFNYIHDIAFTVWNNTVYIYRSGTCLTRQQRQKLKQATLLGQSVGPTQIIILIKDKQIEVPVICPDTTGQNKTDLEVTKISLTYAVFGNYQYLHGI